MTHNFFARLLSLALIVAICATLTGALSANAGRLFASGTHRDGTSYSSGLRLAGLSAAKKAALEKAMKTMSRYMPALRPHKSLKAGTSSGVADATSLLVTPAPAGYRQQLDDQFSGIISAWQQDASLGAYANLPSLVAIGRQLVQAANDNDLADIYSALQELPNQQQSLNSMVRSARWYSSAHGSQKARTQSRLRGHAVGSSCPASGDTTAVRLGLGGAYAIARIVYKIWANSVSIVAAGEGFTLPYSPVRIIVSIFLTVTFLAFSGAQDAYAIREDCIEAAHRSEDSGLNNYFASHAANKQVQVAVTPIDAYHFLIATHENGQPININTSNVQLETFQGTAGPNGQTPLPLILNGQSLCGAPPTQYVCVSGATLSPSIPGTDPGVYELTIPTTMAGTSYQLTVDDGAGIPNRHYGVAVFTKGSNY